LHSERDGGQLPPARAYLFDSRDRLVDSKPAGREPVTFPIAGDQRYRVTVGPDLVSGKESGPSDLGNQLASAKAVSLDYIPRLANETLDFEIYQNIWFCWWQTCILVHGRVQKLLNPGGTPPQYAPICTGTVQIFQVDLGCTLDCLASFDVVLLRDRLVSLMRGIPVLEQATVLAQPASFRAPRLAAARRAQTSAVLGRSTPARKIAESAASGFSPITTATAKANLSLADAITTLPTLHGDPLKQFIVAQKAILWPYFCELIPDWAFCWQELGEVSIQSDGSFAAEICFWCPDDFPDLYFEVVQNVGGVDREISDPPIACSTYYDYDGSTDVVITVDDPSAVACLPDPGRPIPGNELFVWPTAIGNQDLVNITDLEGNPATSTAATGLLSGATPWGGSLSLQMVFDPNLKTSSAIRYYRWSYQFEGDAGFTPISATVTHRYMTVTYGPLMIHLNPVTLGPQTVGVTTNLFAVPDPFPGDGWVDINDPYDRPFAYFDSTDNQLQPFSYTDSNALPRRSGLCTLLLEMFDGAGHLVPAANLGGPGPFKFVLPDLATPGQYTSVLTSNNITPAGQLTFRVRVDNNDVVAQLPGVTTPIGSADECGILHYASGNDLVDVQYVATHPNNYLNWAIGIWKGLSGEIKSASGSTSSPPWSLPAPSTPGSFNNPASALLGSCIDAAFAVNLDVDTTATDGYGRQSQYDRDATIAFALIH
jgi:hypothetical protein